MGGLTKIEAKKLIDNTEIEDEMEENILAKERFAEINMNVTYDVTGDKELPYVLRSFRKAIADKDAAKALNIQHFLIARVLENKYKPDSIIRLPIPREASYVSLLLNQLWLNYSLQEEDTLTDSLATEIYALKKLAPKNEFLIYNSALCNVRLDALGNEKSIDSLQNGIQGLYSGIKVPKERIDVLNLEHQFKIIDALEPIEGAKATVQKSVDRIRVIYKIDGTSWQNALKLSYIFIRNNDYEYAMKILEPFIDKMDKEPVDENLLYCYIALCSYYPEKQNNSKFVQMLRKAHQYNPKRYCKLFGAPYMSFQILDNPFVKEDYCKWCEDAVQPPPPTTTTDKKKKK